MGEPVRMCSSPSSLMISVPDAALLPSVRAPDAALELAPSPRAESRAGTAETASPDECRPFPNGRWWCPCRARPARIGRTHRMGAAIGRRARSSGLIFAKPEPAQIRQMQAARCARDVAERVAARVAVGGRIRHLADADAIEHDPDDAAEAH